jgi:hypothetical protein
LYTVRGPIRDLNKPGSTPEFDFTTQETMQLLAFVNRYQRAYGVSE